MNLPKLQFLVVTDGDVGRSPAMGVLLRRALTSAAAVQVSSAGLVASAGEPVLAHVAKELTALGVTAEGHRSRPLTPGLIAASDLILTGTRAQVSAVLTWDPTALERTFTLRGLARLADALSPRQAEAAAWLPRILGSRGREVQVHSPEDDVTPLSGVGRKRTTRALQALDVSCRKVGHSYRS